MSLVKGKYSQEELFEVGTSKYSKFLNNIFQNRVQRKTSFRSQSLRTVYAEKWILNKHVSVHLAAHRVVDKNKDF